MMYWLERNCKKKGTYYELIQKPLSTLPIIIPNQSKLLYIETLSKNILQLISSNPNSNKLKLEKLLNENDLVFYKIYDLSYSQAKKVDPKIEEKISEEAYNKFQIGS